MEKYFKVITRSLAYLKGRRRVSEQTTKRWNWHFIIRKHRPHRPEFSKELTPQVDIYLTDVPSKDAIALFRAAMAHFPGDFNQVWKWDDGELWPIEECWEL